MLGFTLAALLAFGLEPSAGRCPVEGSNGEGSNVEGSNVASPISDYHLADVCGAAFKGAPAYSVTFQASLSPAPAAQQVMIYQVEEVWFVRIAGYRWKPGDEVVTRRNTLNISDADAAIITKAITSEALEVLSKRPYFGDETTICLDGARLEVAMGAGGRHRKAAQHSCAPKSDMNAIAALFRELALKYDSGFDVLLTGLENGR